MEETINKLSIIFVHTGFTKYTLLNRMHKVNNRNKPLFIDPRVKYAVHTQAVQLHNLFKEYFDKYSEQIPLLEEITKLIDASQVLLISEQKKIMGFIIFEINGLTSYLRYWFVLPEYRDNKIGSALIMRFFYESRNTKRQIFWVISSNENAIKRYNHYGFEAEKLLDQVMIKIP